MNKKRYITIFIIFMLLVLGVISIRQKLVLKLLHPRLYEEYVETYSKEFSIDENLVYSIMKVESKFNKNAISNKKAKGLMQISDITQKWAQDELKLGKVDIYSMYRGMGTTLEIKLLTTIYILSSMPEHTSYLS